MHIYAREVPDQESWVLHGQVLDDTGAPMPSVTVLVKDTDRGTKTDLDGKFIIEIKNTNEILLLSSVGYHNKEVTPGNLRNISISMGLNEQDQKINEVVVVGFGTQKKVSVTGAISDVPVRNLQRIYPFTFQCISRKYARYRDKTKFGRAGV